jgi:hypothetical protein
MSRDSLDRARDGRGRKGGACSTRCRQLSLVVLDDWLSMDGKLAIIVELTTRRSRVLGSKVVSDTLSIDCSGGNNSRECVTHDGEQVESRSADGRRIEAS